jgi:hypothetical protein
MGVSSAVVASPLPAKACATYKSEVRVESAVVTGVWFLLQKMSLARRIELTRLIRDLAERVEFLNAGESPKEKLDAALLSAEIDRIYVLWGLSEVGGLELDGASATPESLVLCGPEELFREALTAVKAACGLSEDERKN